MTGRQYEETDVLERADAAFAEAMADALDVREHETGNHSRRVACHTLVLARRFISDPNRLRHIYWGALMHDIGKIGVPESILLKPGALNEAEWEVMRTHPEKGHRIIAQIPGMADAAEIVLSHQERFDGSGYPRGLHDEQIHLGARLLAVIDTLDAITSDRPYRKGRSFDHARDEIAGMSGKQFDPQAVEAFMAEETTLRKMVEDMCMQSHDPAILPNTRSIS
ncbi:MAG: HD domain-containing protein [Gammaproteobacteria bacterium]|nr:HD domain-containing protein [Gammaproteobacteria bacterium]